MMRVTELKKDLAERAWGTSWYVDSANGTLREWLGNSRPVFQFGETFASLNEAAAAGYGHLEQRHLPETLRLPSQSPILRATRHKDTNSPLTRITVLIFDDLINQGIRIEDREITGVDFSLPTPELLELIDIMPVAIYTAGRPDMKVSINYMRGGNIKISDNPMVLQGSSMVPWTKSMAFFHREDAEKQADIIAAQLTRAADWRSRQVLIETNVPVAEAQAA
jgi:hypothetical protein